MNELKELQSKVNKKFKYLNIFPKINCGYVEYKKADSIVIIPVKTFINGLLSNEGESIINLLCDDFEHALKCTESTINIIIQKTIDEKANVWLRVFPELFFIKNKYGIYTRLAYMEV